MKRMLFTFMLFASTDLLAVDESVCYLFPDEKTLVEQCHNFTPHLLHSGGFYEYFADRTICTTTSGLKEMLMLAWEGMINGRNPLPKTRLDAIFTEGHKFMPDWMQPSAYERSRNTHELFSCMEGVAIKTPH